MAVCIDRCRGRGSPSFRKKRGVDKPRYLASNVTCSTWRMCRISSWIWCGSLIFHIAQMQATSSAAPSATRPVPSPSCSSSVALARPSHCGWYTTRGHRRAAKDTLWAFTEHYVLWVPAWPCSRCDHKTMAYNKRKGFFTCSIPRRPFPQGLKDPTEGPWEPDSLLAMAARPETN